MPSRADVFLSEPVDLPLSPASSRSRGGRHTAGFGGRVLLHWRVVLITIALCTLAAGAFLLLTKRVYASAVVLAVDPEEGDNPDNDVQANVLYAGSGLLRSDDVLRAAIASPTARAALNAADDDDAMEQIAGALRVEVNPAQRTIELTAEASSPPDAAALADAVADAYLGFLTRQAEQERAARDAAPEKGPAPDPSSQSAAPAPPAPRVDPFQASLPDLPRPIPDTSGAEAARAAWAQLSTLTETLTAARIQAANARSVQQAAQVVRDDPGRSTALARANRAKGLYGHLDPETDRIEADLDTLEKEMAIRARTMGPRNPVQLAAQSKIDTLRARLDELDRQKVQIYLAYVDQEATAAAEKVTEMERLVTAQKAIVDEYNAKVRPPAPKPPALAEVTGAAPKSPPQHAGEGMLPAQTQQAASTVPLILPTTRPVIPVRIVRVASLASAPIRPRRLRVMGVGVFGGLLLGIGLASALAWIDGGRVEREVVEGEILDDDGADDNGTADGRRREEPDA